MPAPPARRPFSRRALTRGAVWSVPAVSIAAAAPAYAASACGQVLNWDAYVGTTPPTPILVSGVSISRSVAYGTGTTAGATSNTVVVGPRGGIAEAAYQISMGTAGDPVAVGDSMTVTFGFAPAVYDLQFSILDIDRVANGWRDRVSLSPGFAVIAVGTNVSGNGTAATPFTSTNDVNVPNTSGAGNVTVRYTGPVSSVVVTYANGPTDQGTTAMVTQISDLTFCLRP